MPPDEEEKESKESKKGNLLTRYRGWFVWGVVIVIALVLVFTLKGQANTISLLKAQVLADEQSISELSGNTSTGFSNLSRSLSETKSSLQHQIDALPHTDWTNTIAGINTNLSTLDTNLTAVKTEVDSLSLGDPGPCVLVTDIDSNNLTAEIYWAGEFSVFLTCFGSDMDSAEVTETDSLNCTISQYLANNTTLTLCLRLDNWVYNDSITLGFGNCTLERAYADIGW